MNNLTVLSLTELKRNAKELGLSTTRKTKKDLIQSITSHYNQFHRFLNYTYIRQLGHQGLDGRTFLARHLETGNEVAIKIFKPTKSASSIRREAELQQRASEAGLSPRVHEFDGEGQFIVMDVMEENLFDVFRRQKGVMTTKQQKDVLRLFQELDRIGIFHQDPNLLNFMYKNKKLYIIDFGMAKRITESIRRRHGPSPNMALMPLGFYLKAKSIAPECSLPYLEKMLTKVEP